MGFVAHVPHYVAQVGLPRRRRPSCWSASRSSPGSQWELSALQAAAPTREVEIAEQVADSTEVRRSSSGSSSSTTRSPGATTTAALPLAEERDLPTAEELGAEFERFLAGLDRTTTDGPTGRT